MIRRVLPLVFSVLVGCTLLSRPASAAVISLALPIEGTAAAGEVIDLTVFFNLNGAIDLNGSTVTNLVGVELYVGFTGLTPVAGSYSLGDVFAGVPPDDLFPSDGPCSDPFTGCSYPEDPPFSPQHYLSLVSMLAPWEPTGPGTLFTLKFTATGTNWSLDLFGDEDVALLWDPLLPCDPVVSNCFPPIPFDIVRQGTEVAFGTARVEVGVTVTPPVSTAVPEPATLLLLGGGLAAMAVRKRALRRRVVIAARSFRLST